MRRTRIAVLAATVVALGVTAAGPAAAVVTSGTPGASDAHGTSATGARTAALAKAAALRKAIDGLPAADATAAQVRYKGEDLHWSGAAGRADLRTHRPVKGDERFRAGSITKTFTAAVALQLVHEKKLDLDGMVQHYLPGLLPAHYPDVKVRQLLDYTSGLPGGDTREAPKSPGWDKGRYTTWDHRALVQAGFGKPMEFTPGTRQHYSNIGYNVLGLLIEKVTGRTYEQELRERVIDRVGLKDTYSPGTDPRIKGRHTHGYEAIKDAGGGTRLVDTRLVDTRLVDTTEWNQSETWASGDLITTTADLERFASALFAGRVVPQQELKLMFTVPEVPMYGSSRPAVYSSGLTRIQLVKDGPVYWGKSGSRYGYLSGFGSTQDGTRSLVYSVNSTDAKGDAAAAPDSRIGRIIMAGLGEPRA
ncbi:beta-lactamase family protein [Streptomyces rectiverticillatus]|uniref:serine hydrolase domain-containing protein n=1 Tax=Streptomyces rectiverticillatus TaxID=173860 RepID=UPI0015C35580|nr:serine hydrolase domain-containing protein [Streptomyces rectiverticillatus]QLE73337.1 beta-lactamase family protein [Streptomyces rectiverticillatus]